MLPVGPGDVARASRAGARQIDGAVHGREYVRMLTHAEVVIAAPDGNATAPAIGSVPQGRGKLPGKPLELDEGPIAAFQLHFADEAFEPGDMVHPSISGARVSVPMPDTLCEQARSRSSALAVVDLQLRSISNCADRGVGHRSIHADDGAIDVWINSDIVC